MTSSVAVERPGLGWWAVVRRPQAGAVLALIVFVAVFSLASDRFFTANNFSLILQQSFVLGVLALGQTLVILTAGIDLSLGALAVLGTIVAAQLSGSPLIALAVAAVTVTALSGLNGWITARFDLPPFIVTLGSFTVATAVAYLVSGSRSAPVPDGPLSLLGEGFRVGDFTVSWGIPVLLALYLAFTYVLGHTAWGNRVYAVGSNRRAADLVGIRTRRLLISVYLCAGALYAIAAWLSLGRTSTADPNAMQNVALQSITAVVLGGTSFFGGRGHVLGTLVGVLIIGVLRNGLTLLGVDSLYQDIVTGTLLIIVVIIDRTLTRKEPR